MNFRAFLNTLSSRMHTLPIVILYVTEGCNLQCVMCSYREPLPNELSLSEIKELALQLKQLGLQHIVYSGGEPLLRKDFHKIVEIFSQLSLKQTLLTNGLLLEKRFDEIAKYFSEIIISLDGPTAEIHNVIRGIEAFEQIVRGVKKITAFTPRPLISIRTVIQKKNFMHIMQMVDFAQSINANRISFLPVDILSDSFGRYSKETALAHEDLILSEDEIKQFREHIQTMIEKYKEEFATKFISDSPQSLLNRVQYFEALLGKNSFPKNNCNAPNVSAVITSNGNIQPCFFLSSFGNIREQSLTQAVNNKQIRAVRNDVRNYREERCTTCVCTLNVNPVSALLNNF